MPELYDVQYNPTSCSFCVYCESLGLIGFGSFETEALAEKFVKTRLLELARDILVALA